MDSATEKESVSVSAATTPMFFIVTTCNEEGTVIERKSFGFASYADPSFAATAYAQCARESLRSLKRDGCTVSLSTR